MLNFDVEEIFNDIKTNQKYISCDHCLRTFCSNDHFQQHLRSIIEFESNTIPDLNQPVYPSSGYEDYEGYQDLIQEKINEIKDREKVTRNYRIINCQINCDYTYGDLDQKLLDIYCSQSNAFKINIGFQGSK